MPFSLVLSPALPAAPAFSAAFALAGVFFLSRRLADARVAAATVLCAACYPVFVAEAVAASENMPVTALTAWGLFCYFSSLTPRGGVEGGTETIIRPGAWRAFCVALFALAALAKETAAVTPAALCAWELSGRAVKWEGPGGADESAAGRDGVGGRRPFAWTLSLLLALAPLAARWVYSRAAGATPSPVSMTAGGGASSGAAAFFAWAFARLGHFTVHEGLWALTLAGGAAMLLAPRRDGGAERPRIAVPAQLAVGALVAAYVLFLPLFGATDAGDALPVLPAVILVWVSTLWRRVPAWPVVVALCCAAFLYHLR